MVGRPATRTAERLPGLIAQTLFHVCASFVSIDCEPLSHFILLSSTAEWKGRNEKNSDTHSGQAAAVLHFAERLVELINGLIGGSNAVEPDVTAKMHTHGAEGEQGAGDGKSAGSGGCLSGVSGCGVLEYASVRFYVESLCVV